MAKHAAKCPKCGHPFEVDTAAGGSVTCPKCQATLNIAGRGRRAKPVDPLIGASLGEFEVHELLGRGGMGAVYKGHQKALERVVAIKTLPRRLAANADFVTRFHREARTAAQLRHTHLVQVYAVGEAQGIHYIVMEFVDGEGLDGVLRRDGPLEPEAALAYLKQTCAGLAAAHEAGIVHRDIKPSNLMIDAQGEVRITDFGLAKRTEGDVAVTMTGQSVGTPLYMAPEMAKGEESDARGDLYSLGAAFYHLLAGRPPFQGRTPSELIVKHATETPRPLGEVAPHVDRRLTAVIDRLLRKNPDSRVASAQALLDELEALGKLRRGPVAGRVADPGAGTLTMAAGKRRERQFAARKHEERRRAARKRTALIAGGVSIALLIALGLVAWVLTRGGQSPRDQANVPKPPTSALVPVKKPDPREEGAQNVFTNASKAAALGKWSTAAAHLARLDKDYASTKHYASNRSAIAALRSKIDAKLKPPTKPATYKLPQPKTLVERAAALGLEPGLVMVFYEHTEPHRFLRATVSPHVTYDWQNRPPIEGVPFDFLTRLVGWLWIDADRNQQFRFWADDGARLYLDGKLVLDAWMWGTRNASVSVALSAGWHRLWVEHIDRQSMGGVKLFWLRDGRWISVPPDVFFCEGSLLDRARQRPSEDPLTGLRPDEPVVPPGAEPAGDWVSLFDGKSLNGWEAVDGDLFAEHGAIEAREGQLVLGTGKVLTGVRWTADFPTSDYEVALEASRLIGSDAFCNITFPIGSSLCTFSVGSWGGSTVALHLVDGRKGDGNVTTRKVSFEQGRWYRVRLRVTAARIEAWIDHEQVIGIGRAGHTFSVVACQLLRPFGLHSSQTTAGLRNIRYRRLGAKPAAAPAGDWVSLFDGKTLGAWQPVERFESTASVEDGKLVLAARPEWNAIHWRVDVPREDYELTYETMRVLGSRDFGTLAFAIGGATHCMLHIGTGEGNLAGLSNVDNKDYRSNGTAVPFPFENGRWYAVKLRVTAERVEAWVDGRKLVDMARAGHTFAPASHRLRDIKAFGLCSYNTAAAVRDIRLRRLDAEAAAPRFFHGAVRRLADGRVELSHDWSNAEQLGDWTAAGDKMPSIVEGELRCGGDAGRGMVHVATFAGDIEVAGGWRLLAGQPNGNAGATICRAGERFYSLALRETNTRIFKRPGDRTIGLAKPKYAFRQAHTFRLVRVGDSLKAWLDGQFAIEGRDPDFTKGGVSIGAHQVVAAFRDIRILGKLDPAWLKQHPGAAAQIAAAPVTGAAEPARPKEEGFAELVKQIVAAGRGADWAEAARLLKMARVAKPDHPDLKPLVEWLRASSKPLLEEDFDTLRRSRWDVKTGGWRVEGGQLVCRIGPTSGLLALRGRPPRDFVLTFDMANGPREVGFRLGALVRWTPQRHLSFTITDEFDRVGYHGGVNKAPDGISVDYLKNNGAWKIETGRVYRVAVRCEGKTLEDYLDGKLFMRCTDERPTLGGICLHAHRADARFDNLRLYPAVPLPKLESLPQGR